ncbi:response regulator transcription factor [Pseudoduganella umbonata]|uniref:DNA-binding response OmpR family regulator n=1 Tax=Pseudoduganella umbonata TaxID=864828 RepID=A0A4P8HVN2_9BURK|nr:response regulator transcription factor [Pseudoduganella umbonata]MBB3224103.1 DNA-binding response OmpR family regulator [Pseudoduganella umbonata]QCP14033.1 response regulator transcription factor [Pseudoduganella umbonata]
MNRIAVIEDHERLSLMVGKALSAAGIEADLFARIDSAWLALKNTPYALIVVDRGLPDGDGLSLVRRLRDAGHLVPCLMLTARNALHDRVEGLESGADDYLVKPFSMEELVARVRALMRRPAAMQSLTPSYVDLRIVPEAATMHCGGESASLAPAELQIMLGLVQAGGKTVRRNALESAAWGLSEAVTPNAMDVAMHRLRKKLYAIGSSVQIVNLRGLGYALSDLGETR